MRKIIISYRRADSDAIAGRIRDRLASHFGEDSIFMDIDSIPFGTDFRDYIRDALFDGDVLVAVVGPKWLGPGKGGHLRIKEENDPIRIEVETALDRGIAVIPVLVNGALMPKPSELPSTLANFAFRNAADVDSGRDFHPHLDRLIRSIDQILLAKGKATAATGGVSAPNTVTDAGSTPVEAARVAEPVEPKREPPPAPAVAAALISVAAAGVTEPPPMPPPVQRVPPSGKPKAAASVIALAAGGGAAFAAALAGAAIWFYARPAPPVVPVVTPPVQQQPQQQQQATPVLKPRPVVEPGCPGTPAFRDDFRTVDPGWELGDSAHYVDGQLAIRTEANTGFAVLYRSLIYKNATICLDVKTPPTANTTTDYGGGLIFWAVDYSNYYRAVLTPDGQYQVGRRANGTWWTVTPLTKFEGLKQGYGVTNRIKVSTVGNIATIYFNDRKAQDVKGQPPRAGGSVGMYAGSEKEQVNDWRFLDIAVFELPATQTVAVPPSEASTKAMLAACKLGPSAAFADDFKVPNPSWNGLDDDIVAYKDGRLVITPTENKIGRAMELGLIYKDITICAEVTSPPQMKAENDTAGGVVFWATGFPNNYYARVFPDGSYSVGRAVDGTILTVIPKTSDAAINKGPNAQNRVKVVLNGAVGTLYINDVKMREFRGQPPANGSAFGLYADSETDRRSDWRFNGIVVVEP